MPVNSTAVAAVVILTRKGCNPCEPFARSKRHDLSTLENIRTPPERYLDSSPFSNPEPLSGHL